MSSSLIFQRKKENFDQRTYILSENTNEERPGLLMIDFILFPLLCCFQNPLFLGAKAHLKLVHVKMMKTRVISVV